MANGIVSYHWFNKCNNNLIIIQILKLICLESEIYLRGTIFCSLNSSILYFNFRRKNCITEVNAFTGSATIEGNICSWISYVLVLYYYSVQSYNKQFINRVCSCHTEKYRTLVFQHSPRKLGLYEDRSPVFLSMTLAPRLINRYYYTAFD